MNIIYLLIGMAVGSALIYISLRPKMKSIQKFDLETLEKNEALKDANVALIAENNDLNTLHSSLKDEYKELEKQCELVKTQKAEIENSLGSLNKQYEATAQAIYNDCMNTASEAFNNAAERLSRDYNTAKEVAQREYLEMINEYAEDFQFEVEGKKEQLSAVEKELADLRKKLECAVDAYKREQEMADKVDFYRLKLPGEDLREIGYLIQATLNLRNPEAINKVIWKVYYEKPYTSLIGRVIGNKKITGIYKITNIENHMCYIGQAVDIADRWKQHIKRGLGAETATKNKLYPAMREYGVENFTFEIIEECEREKLNEREQYWQNYFHAKDYGYSIK